MVLRILYRDFFGGYPALAVWTTPPPDPLLLVLYALRSALPLTSPPLILLASFRPAFCLVMNPPFWNLCRIPEKMPLYAIIFVPYDKSIIRIYENAIEGK